MSQSETLAILCISWYHVLYDVIVQSETLDIGNTKSLLMRKSHSIWLAVIGFDVNHK